MTLPPSGPAGFMGRRRRWLIAAFWLVFLGDAVTSTLDRNADVLVGVGLAGIGAFALLYVASVALVGRLPGRSPWRFTLPVAMFLLATALLPLTGEDGLAMYPFVTVVAILLLPTMLSLPFVGGLALASVAAELLVPRWPGSPLEAILPIATASAAVFGVVSIIRRNAQLAEARDRIAVLAVEEERARFARDLHDLLGHSLTVITLKAELAGRLLELDPGRAAAEIADVQRLGREALVDVRATVGGYRGVALASEVAAARSALEAAGISCELPGAVDDVPGDRRELFGWVVREGVTNVVRHSGAKRVSVAVDATSVEVVDDGQGCPDYGPRRGHGLTGLQERVAAAGGTLECGPLTGGGFRLCAVVPPLPRQVALP